MAVLMQVVSKNALSISMGSFKSKGWAALASVGERMQRAMSFLPVEIDPIARFDAQTSTEWRLTMWKRILPDVPKYLLLGKGYAINSSELSFLMTSGVGRIDSSELAILAGDFHNGPLTLIMPFGIWGVIGFGWFTIASLRVLSRNYRFSPPALLNLNRFLLVFFIARIIYFFVFFGSFYSDFFLFAGIIGLSTSLNRGVRTPKASQVIARERQPVTV